MLFGTTRLLIILIHELLGHLLKGKINRITNNKIKMFTESKGLNIQKKKEDYLLNIKCSGKWKKFLHILNVSNSYNKNANDFLENFKKINKKKNFNNDINSNLISFLKALNLDKKNRIFT